MALFHNGLTRNKSGKMLLGFFVYTIIGGGIIPVLGCHYFLGLDVRAFEDSITIDNLLANTENYFLNADDGPYTFICQSSQYVPDGPSDISIRWTLDGEEIPSTQIPTDPVYVDKPHYDDDTGYDVVNQEWQITLPVTSDLDFKTLSCELEFIQPLSDNDVSKSTDIHLRVCPTGIEPCSDLSNCEVKCDGMYDCNDQSDEDGCEQTCPFYIQCKNGGVCTADLTCDCSTTAGWEGFDCDILPPSLDYLTLSVDGVEYQPGDEIVLMQGHHEFVCLSSRTHPVATIDWTIDNQAVAESSGVATQNSFDVDLFDYRSTLEVDVEYDKHCGISISCTASNNAPVTAPAVIMVQLLVISPPDYLSPWITLSSGVSQYSTNADSAILIDGQDYTFSCSIFGADPGTSLEWTLQQIISDPLMTTIHNADELKPNCDAAGKQGFFSFEANVDEQLGQKLMCSGNNDYFTIDRFVRLDVQIAFFEFGQCVYFLNEASGTLQVRVLRRPNVGDEFADSISASVRVESTAISASDLFDFESRDILLEFAPGENERVFPIALSNNRVPEATESFNITLSEPNGGRLGECFQATIIIADDDTVYTFVATNYQALESGDDVIIPIIREGQTEVQGSVDVNILSITAREGVDYTIIGSTSVVFPPGSTNETFRLSLIDDFSVEDTKTLPLQLVNPEKGFVKGIPITEVVLTDDDATFSLIVFPTEVQEMAGNVFVTCTVRREGYLQNTVTVYLRTITSQRSKRAEDFVPVDRPLTFVPGQSTSEEVRIMIPNDDEPEDTSTFTIEIYGIPPEAVGEQIAVEVTIRDDIDNNQAQDSSTFSFESDSYTVLESEKVPITIVREGVLNRPGSIVLFTGSYNEGSNPIGDYPRVTTMVHFDVGVSRQTVEIQALDDVIAQTTPDRFWVGLREALGGKSGNINMATITVQDDDVLLSFETTEFKVSENADILQIEARRTGYTGPLNLELITGTLNGNPAVEGEDFRIPDVINFLDGVDSATIDIVIIDDDVTERAETFVVKVTHNDDVIGEVTVSIIDNDDAAAAESDTATDAQVLNNTSLLLLACGGAVLLIGLIVGVIVCAVCIRSLKIPQPPRSQQVLVQVRPQVNYPVLTADPWNSGRY